MNWSGHWHGYGPWTGTRHEYGKEHLRRPGPAPDDEQTRTFLAQTLPPVQTGHALLKRNQTTADRTWTVVCDAVDWLKKTCAVNPPYERAGSPSRTHVMVEEKAHYAEDALSRGVDVVWAYYIKSQNFVAYSVVCCPNHFHPGITCPLPPS
ncbi:hypothetical protein E0L36_19740 [Streptomyces sp. AJS327]|uniref:hypothetical protein n=1 Tax=Streptomyces sp. AJS327 TaxID=2545265 RepID=UPI0015DE7357|nr:hypothetical protein [Streptomyces sp. AJS327]MBA0053024.1 hypothetical protein [Streptomyces sp. AJS327]